MKRRLAEFGEFKKALRANTSVAYRVPTRDIFEKGLREQGLDRYPKGEEAMSEYKDFWQADLGRIIRDLETELSGGYPDWERVLLKADDLTALALAAFKSAQGSGDKKSGTLVKSYEGNT
ncbi:MAG: hypothetical protein PHQ43_15735 [Dehalococcoidales bacterium]|nr:hypothetical protein [Dehalococcoidales bacterium]